jgi:Fe-S-cluster formation regulator IscX/YfhJ
VCDSHNGNGGSWQDHPCLDLHTRTRSRVNEHFDLKAWVCVLDEFDVFRVTKTVLEAMMSSTCERSFMGFT